MIPLCFKCAKFFNAMNEWLRLTSQRSALPCARCKVCNDTDVHGWDEQNVNWDARYIIQLPGFESLISDQIDITSI